MIHNIRQFRVFIKRMKKADPQSWILRWDYACARLWKALGQKPCTVEKFKWFERNHARLMRVAARKRNWITFNLKPA